MHESEDGCLFKHTYVIQCGLFETKMIPSGDRAYLTVFTGLASLTLGVHVQ